MIKEIQGNIWSYHKREFPVVITTNGSTKKDGTNVMGKGNALQAKVLFPEFPAKLGEQLRAYGNNCFYFHDYNIITFPVKENWFEKANLLLIERSCKQLMELVDDLKFKKIIIPRPGCKNGLLKWTEVKPICEQYFDDRVQIVDMEVE